MSGRDPVGLEVLDRIDVQHLVCSDVPIYPEVPTKFIKTWVAARGLVLRLFNRLGPPHDPADELRRDRHLKLILVLPQLVLVVPPHGGPQGDSYTRKSFDMLFAAQYMPLFERWRTNRRRCVSQRVRRAAARSSVMEDPRQQCVMSGVKLVARGFKSKGIARMTSDGVADSALPVVQESLKKLHPPRAKRVLTMEELDTMGVPGCCPWT